MAYKRDTTLTRIHLHTINRLRRLAQRFGKDMVDLLDIAVDLLDRELSLKPSIAFNLQLPLAEAVKPYILIAVKPKGVKYG